MKDQIRKGVNIFAYSLIITAIIVAVFTLFSNMVNSSFKENGIKTTAQIEDKFVKAAIGKTFAEYNILLLKYSANRKFIEKELSVDENIYKTYTIGDSIEIYFLKNDNRAIRLAKRIDNYNYKSGYNLTGIILILGIIILLSAKKIVKKQSGDFNK